MKTLFFVALLGLFAVTAQAQVYTMLQATGATVDTVTNAGTAYIARPVSGAATSIGVQVAIEKVSGTLAGTLTFSGSVDGTNFYTIGSTQTITDTAGTKYYLFTLDGNLAPYRFYRVTGAGMTTGVYYISGTLVRK